MSGKEPMPNGKRFIQMFRNLIDKLRYLVLRFALPKQQFYIQCGGFHSVFHPIILERKEGVFNGTGNKDNNGE